jgi:hypothetical protein
MKKNLLPNYYYIRRLLLPNSPSSFHTLFRCVWHRAKERKECGKAENICIECFSLVPTVVKFSYPLIFSHFLYTLSFFCSRKNGQAGRGENEKFTAYRSAVMRAAPKTRNRDRFLDKVSSCTRACYFYWALARFCGHDLLPYRWRSFY